MSEDETRRAEEWRKGMENRLVRLLLNLGPLDNDALSDRFTVWAKDEREVREWVGALERLVAAGRVVRRQRDGVFDYDVPEPGLRQQPTGTLAGNSSEPISQDELLAMFRAAAQHTVLTPPVFDCVAFLQRQLADRDARVRELEAENRRLWLACGKMMEAYGTADGAGRQSVHTDDTVNIEQLDDANESRVAAIELLDGLIPLTPKEDA